jgi:hypothetical protein
MAQLEGVVTAAGIKKGVSLFENETPHHSTKPESFWRLFERSTHDHYGVIKPAT